LSGRWNVSIVNFSVDNVAPAVILNSPADDVGLNGSLFVNYSVSDLGEVESCSLYLDGVLNSTNSSVGDLYNYFDVDGFDVGSYSWLVSCVDNSSNVGNSSEREFSVVVSSEFGGDTTDLGEINVSNVSNLVVEVVGFGKINWSESVDLSGGVDLDSYVNISENRIEVNSSVLGVLNKSARLSLYGLSFDDPVILKDGVECSDCSEVGYSGGVLIFDVNGFSVYSATEGSSGSIVDGVVSSRSFGGSSGYFVSECYGDSWCEEGYSCYGGECVKLFDVEVLSVDSLVDGLSLSLLYLVKGMADFESDVVIEFWLEFGEEVIELGRDTIYLGSFEEKVKETVLNLPDGLVDGGYDLYVSASFENYTARSFRKVNIVDGKVGGLRFWFWVFLGLLVLVLGVLVLKVKRVFWRRAARKMILHIENGFKVKTKSEFKDDFGFRDFYNKKVYGRSGRVVGRVRRVVLGDGGVCGWVIKFGRRFLGGGSVYVRGDDVRREGGRFYFDGDVEKGLFGSRG
jgi:hypothetical protein